MISKPLKDYFNAKDSGLLFSLVLLFVNIIIFIYSFFVNDLEAIFGRAKDLVGIALIQAVFLFSCIFYCRRFGINITRALQIKTKFNKKYTLMSALTGLTMMYALAIPAMLCIEFLKSLGYVPDNTFFEIKSGFDLLLGTIFIAILPAVCEEILFRGIILQGLRRFGDVFAIIVSALFFMLMHTNPSQTLYPFLSGLVLGFVFIKTGDIKYSILIHFLNNFLGVVIEFIYNFFDIAYDTTVIGLSLSDFIFAGIGLVIFAFCLLYFKKQKGFKNNINQTLIFKPQYNIYQGLKVSKNNRQKYYIYQGLKISKNNRQNNDTEQVFNINNKNDNVDEIKADTEKSTEFLQNLGFIYNNVNNTYVLQESTNTDIDLPIGFEDVTKQAKYNFDYISKKKFFLYSAFGIVICIATWLLVFFS